jgi:hypothetical protein
MDAKIRSWKSLPATLSDFVCAVPLSAIECKALAGILPEQCPRLEQIQVHSRSRALDFLFVDLFSCMSTSLAAIFRDRCRRSSASSRHVALLYSLKFFTHRHLKHHSSAHPSASRTHTDCDSPQKMTTH